MPVSRVCTAEQNKGISEVESMGLQAKLDALAFSCYLSASSDGRCITCGAAPINSALGWKA